MDYLTIPEACKSLRISRSSLYRLIDAGKLVRVKPSSSARSGAARITRESFDAYRESLLPVLR